MVPPSPNTPAVGSPWAPFRHRVFTMLWIATVTSNVGTWMQSAAAGWLMTSLNPDPLAVALVQAATMAPMFLFGLPAGALADILDRRRMLLAAQTTLALVTAGFAVLVGLGAVTPWTLLAFTFLGGTGAALIAPTWQAIVPQLVPRSDLAPAVAANSVGINVSRAIGPALAGALIGTAGIAAPFWANAVSYVVVIAALIWWRPPPPPAAQLPAERFASAIRLGLRHAFINPHLRATLLRGVGFFIFASTYWALLPLVAREQVSGGPALYGLLLGAIGASAVVGAFLIPVVKRRFGPDGVATAGSIGTALALVLFALAREPLAALAASVLAGMSWIAVLATINVSAQVALPGWVRGRGLAVFVTVQFGALSLGSLIWGQVAAVAGLPVAHLAAAAGLVATIPLVRRWRLQTGAGLDLTPSMHWPAPEVAADVPADRGPVVVSVAYRVDPDNREGFLAALHDLARHRRGDGAFGWGVYEDAADPRRFVEAYYVESWLDHLRQHDRVTGHTRAVQERVNAFHTGDGPPQVTHLIAAERA